ncbi:uncharacterized protein J3R85_007253 [Psidium guajava]|nr:uncharacterized protein J3R85_007253 [Psidium guajava]
MDQQNFPARFLVGFLVQPVDARSISSPELLGTTLRDDDRELDRGRYLGKNDFAPLTGVLMAEVVRFRGGMRTLLGHCHRVAGMSNQGAGAASSKVNRPEVNPQLCPRVRNLLKILDRNDLNSNRSYGIDGQLL